MNTKDRMISRPLALWLALAGLLLGLAAPAHAIPQQYTLTYTAGANGTVNGFASVIQTVGELTSGTAVTAVPNTWCRFVKWSDGCLDNPRIDTNVSKDISVSAIFMRSYIVEFKSDGTAGVKFSGSTPRLIDEGTSTSVTVIPPAGQRFVKWTLDGADYSTFNPLVLLNVKKDMSFVAHFEPWSAYKNVLGVDNLSSDGLKLIDPLTHTAYGPYFGKMLGGGDSGLYDAAMTADGKTALVSNFGNSRIQFLDLSTPGSPKMGPTSLTLSFFTEDIALTPNGKYALVTDGGFTPYIATINVPTRQLVRYTTTTVLNKDAKTTSILNHQAIAISSDGETVMTVDYFGRRISVYRLNPATGGLTFTGMFDTAPYLPVNVEFSRDGKTAIAANASTTSPSLVGANPLVMRVDAPGTATLVGAVPLPLWYTGAQSVVFSRGAGNKAYYSAVRRKAVPTTSTFYDPKNPYNGDLVDNEVLVLNVNGPGQVSYSGVSIPIADQKCSSQLFGVDTLATEPSGRYLYASGMSVSGTSTTLAVLDLNQNKPALVIQPGYANKLSAVVSTGVAFPSFDQFRVEFRANGAPGASFVGNTSQTVIGWHDCTPVRAIAPTGYHFMNWTGAVTTTTNPLAVSRVLKNMQLTANFAINQYTLAYTAGAHGTLSGTTAQTVNYGASGTAVTAVPAAGYHFVKWSDNSTANPRTDVNVAKNVAVTASFAITQYTLTYAAGAHGTLSGKTPQPVSYGASGTAVTAIPETGYHFVKWSDNSTANPRTDLNVTKNISVTASFAINQYAVTFRTDGTQGASLTGTLMQTVNYGANCTAVTAKAPAGSAFVKWTRNGLTYSRNNPLTVTGVKEAMVLRAVFNPGNAAKDWSRYE